mmetsp:Transcript_46174/g.74260  ORF Transcript_46174/g.74260 Transcript_46174/m.74260 type:complete len:446 (-) Transcript_46174:81-1418(-)
MKAPRHPAPNNGVQSQPGASSRQTSQASNNNSHTPRSNASSDGKSGGRELPKGFGESSQDGTSSSNEEVANTMSMTLSKMVQQTNLIRNEVINVLSDWGKISGRTLQELSTGDVSLLMRQIVKRKRNIEVNQERLKQLSERLQSFAKTQFKSPLDSNPSALLPWSNTQEGDEKGSHGPATSSPNRIPAGNRRELAAIGTRARIAAAHLEQYAASQSSPSLAICMAYWKAGLERSPLTSLNAIIEWIETRHSREKMRVRRLASDTRISSAGPDASGSVSVGKKKETNMEIEAVSDDVKTRSESRLAAGVLVELPNVCYVAILFDKPGQGKCVESIEASGWHEGPEAALQADPSRAMAFKSMSVQCAASLQQIKQALRAAKGLAVLSFLVDWLANYSTLFKTKCEWCQRYLGEEMEDSDRMNLLPPTLRTLPYGRAFHPCCRREASR